MQKKHIVPIKIESDSQNEMPAEQLLYSFFMAHVNPYLNANKVLDPTFYSVTVEKADEDFAIKYICFKELEQTGYKANTLGYITIAINDAGITIFKSCLLKNKHINCKVQLRDMKQIKKITDLIQQKENINDQVIEIKYK